MALFRKNTPRDDVEVPEWLLPVAVVATVVMIGWMGISAIVGAGGEPNPGANTTIPPNGGAPIIIGDGPVTTLPGETPQPTNTTTPGGATTSPTATGGEAPEWEEGQLAEEAGRAFFSGDWSRVPLAAGATPPEIFETWPNAVPISAHMLDRPAAGSVLYVVTVDPDGDGPEAARTVVIQLVTEDGRLVYQPD